MERTGRGAAFHVGRWWLLTSHTLIVRRSLAFVAKRQMLGWSLEPHRDVALMLQALNRVGGNRRLSPGVISLVDRGVRRAPVMTDVIAQSPTSREEQSPRLE